MERLVNKGFNVSDDLKNKVMDYVTGGKIRFTLGDWFTLLKLSVEYVNVKLSGDLWSVLPTHYQRNLASSVSDVERYFFRDGVLKWLNAASHEGALKEIHENVENRTNALNAVLKLKNVVASIMQSLPELVLITKRVTEVKTGLEHYEAVCAGSKRPLKIYGIRFLEPQFLYYLIPQFESRGKNIIVYPILITNLTGVVF